MPRKINADVPCGIYIEIKDYAFYKDLGIDVADMLFTLLKENGLDTIENAIKEENGNIPIII